MFVIGSRGEDAFHSYRTYLVVDPLDPLTTGAAGRSRRKDAQCLPPS